MGTVLPKDPTSSPGQNKLAAEIVAVSDYEKKDKKASFTICVEKKNINGTPKTLLKLQNFSTPGPSNEYTNVAKFKKRVVENIDHIIGELG
jgi:hypothetical protein